MDNKRPHQCFCSETEIKYLQELMSEVDEEQTYNIVKDNLLENRNTSVIFETMLLDYHVNLKPRTHYTNVLKLINEMEDFIRVEG